ncbi:MAG: transcriptional regulator/sugar kinase [Firmicutes bacterium]|nr:transcriptional regulator/sugar kinase [Bacillota bacterium]
MYVLGLDIGGTKLAAGVVAPDGRLLSWQRTPTGAAEGPGAVIGRLLRLGRLAVERAGVDWRQIAAAGVGCGGPLDPDQGVILGPPHLPGWVELPLGHRLEGALGIPVYIDNDANAAALGEHRFGAGRGTSNLVYLTISTGVGGGVIINDRLYRGENGNAGEIGHMSVDYKGRRCVCGRQGCLEAYVSGTAIAARAREAVQAGRPSALRELAGHACRITAELVVAAMQAGDALAAAIWAETVTILAAGLTNVIHIYNPRLVVLGGGVTNAGDLLFEPVRRLALGAAFPRLAAAVEIVPARLGGQVGVFGAAAVALDRLEPEGREACERV